MFFVFIVVIILLAMTTVVFITNAMQSFLHVRRKIKIIIPYMASFTCG
jgi:hypothetical protein